MESVLFALTSIAESVDLEENNYLPSLFRMLGQVPCSHPKLISQALNAIGKTLFIIRNITNLCSEIFTDFRNISKYRKLYVKL